MPEFTPIKMNSRQREQLVQEIVTAVGGSGYSKAEEQIRMIVESLTEHELYVGRASDGSARVQVQCTGCAGYTEGVHLPGFDVDTFRGPTVYELYNLQQEHSDWIARRGRMTEGPEDPHTMMCPLCGDVYDKSDDARHDCSGEVEG